VVFADPSNTEARELQADAFEQLGYQTESSTWRNAYLMGAQELRHGTPSYPIGSTASEDSIRAMTLPMIFNFFAIKIHGVNAADLELDLNLDITDTGESAVLRLSNGVLSHSMVDRDPDAPALAMTRDLLNRLVGNEVTLEDAVAAGEVEAGPGLDVFRKFGEHLDEFDLWFPIIEP
jgi:alkyl sulfatase BDS1-like metallo-beta-lactamase superfamily hydrolase